MITPETLTDEMISALRDSQPVTAGFKRLYIDCVRSLGTDPVSGGICSNPMTKRAREAVCRHLNDVLSGVQCPGCGANQTDEDGKCHWCRVKYRGLDSVVAVINSLS